MELHQQIVENVVLFGKAPVVLVTDFGQNRSPEDGSIDSNSITVASFVIGNNAQDCTRPNVVGRIINLSKVVLHSLGLECLILSLRNSNLFWGP